MGLGKPDAITSPFSPAFLVRFDEPIEFFEDDGGWHHRADLLVQAERTEDLCAAEVKVPQGAATAYVMIVNQGQRAARFADVSFDLLGPRGSRAWRRDGGGGHRWMRLQARRRFDGCNQSDVALDHCAVGVASVGVASRAQAKAERASAVWLEGPNSVGCRSRFAAWRPADRTLTTLRTSFLPPSLPQASRHRVGLRVPPFPRGGGRAGDGGLKPIWSRISPHKWA